ncbi:MAG: geranylgeranylglycerol-phosphate geranylgeranyltransferase [Saprospiraceae bacterium]|nr:geranylgeranylglycerol-phosphate geranylgeranyltransferase [Saprospiraceae bacterium]
MKPILRLIRFPNLVIVVLTQYLLQYAVLIPAIKKMGMLPVLPHFEFFLLVLSTVLIAAGGYVVNDIEDVAIDRLNKPEHKRIVERIYSIRQSWWIYWFLTILGFVISLYLAIYVKNLGQLLIYPLAVFLLYAYSHWFKRQPLTGNLVVSFFCAFVAWVVFYAQSLAPIFSFFMKTHWLESVQTTFVGYAVFAFFSTLFREIVKDIEDAEGDLAGDCRTLPIVLGVLGSKIVAALVGVLFIGFIGYFSFLLRGSNSMIKILILNLTVTLPMLYALFLLIKAKEKKEFSFLSQLAKAIMLSGLIFIVVMKWA